MSDDADDNLEPFFERALDPLFVADGESRLLRVNPALAELLGYAEEELVGRGITDFVHAEDLQQTLDALDDVTSGRPVRDLENRLECSDGSVRWFSWRATWDPSYERIYGSAREITEQKEIDRLKDEFVSVVSHELRTPLTSLRGALGIALHTDEDLPDQIERMLEIADQNTERLELLVDDILDIEKIQSGDLDVDPEPVAPCEVLDEVADSNASYADDYTVELEVSCALDDQEIRVDPDRLFQILTNFASNAVKYSPEEGTVTLAAQPMHGGREVRMSVTDRGEGIVESFRDEVFDRFTQADASTTRRRQGSGLGLSIAKALTEQMGGSIDFVTEVGEGTTFYVDFPVLESETSRTT